MALTSAENKLLQATHDAAIETKNDVKHINDWIKEHKEDHHRITTRVWACVTASLGALIGAAITVFRG